jgi:predicted nucleic acid-binding protein
LLRDLFSEVIIPSAVYEEVVSAGRGRAGGPEVENAQWIIHHQVKNKDLVTFLSISLDAGEAEAIALAKEINADLVLLDDNDGRNIAGSVGIHFTGTIGLLLRYYQGQPADFKEALDELLAQGFRLSKAEYQKILEQA